MLDSGDQISAVPLLDAVAETQKIFLKLVEGVIHSWTAKVECVPAVSTIEVIVTSESEQAVRPSGGVDGVI